MPILRKKFDGTTMVELLVVMIISGILFLLLFDGLSLVQRYGRILDHKLMEKSHLLYSHQTFEMLLDRTDSICRIDNELSFYTRTEQRIEVLEIDTIGLLLRRNESVDTLFGGFLKLELHPDEAVSRIDSFFVWMRIGKDTIKLEYENYKDHR